MPSYTPLILLAGLISLGIWLRYRKDKSDLAKLSRTADLDKEVERIRNKIPLADKQPHFDALNNEVIELYRRFNRHKEAQEACKTLAMDIQSQIIRKSRKSKKVFS